MEWADKVTMVSLFNENDPIAFTFIKEHAKDIIEDPQAFEILLNSISITTDNINNNREILKLFIINNDTMDQLSLRSNIRYNIFKAAVLQESP
jgi:hypothetical protein